MDSLPTELLEYIVGECNYASLKTLRATSHKWHRLTTPLVFSAIYFAPCIFQEALDNLWRLIRSGKNLSRHVTHLQIYADILPARDRPRFERLAAGHTQDEETLRSAYTGYEALLLQQHDCLRNKGQHLELLKEAISSLPNLTSISAGIALPFRGSTARWPVWKRLKRRILISPDDWMYEDDADYRDNPHRMRQTTDFLLQHLEAIGFRASFAGIKQIRELDLEMLHQGRLRSLMAGVGLDDPAVRVFSLEVETHFQTMTAAFEHLTTLDLQVPHQQTGTSRPLHADEWAQLLVLAGAETSTMLLRARNLRTLHFAYDSEAGTFWSPGEEAQHPLHPLLAPSSSASPWPHLTHLDLSINVPHTLLLSFLALLSPSLERLELRDMCVYDAQALIAGLPKVVRPKSIYFECLWTKINVRYANIHSDPTTCILCEGTDIDAQYERGVKAYLLSQADDFPRLTDKIFLTDDELAQIPVEQ